MKIGRLLLRAAVGGFFIGHGTQKLFGWFGGQGLDATAQGFDQLGLCPGRRNAIAAGVAEAGGGALLAAGLETPLAASVLTATMLTAIRRVHAKKGPWLSNGGYEYNVVLIAAALALADAGPGRPSLDAARGRERCGSGWALAALGAGAVGAIAANAAATGAAETVPPARGAKPAAASATASRQAEAAAREPQVPGTSQESVG